MNRLRIESLAIAAIALVASCHSFSAEPAIETRPAPAAFETLPLPALAAPDAARPNNATDPAEKHASRVLLAATPEMRQKPVPFVRVTLPDPLELQKLLGLKQQPADNDPPVSAAAPSPAPAKP